MHIDLEKHEHAAHEAEEHVSPITGNSSLVAQPVSETTPTHRQTKQPSDVYQMLRQISWHHQQIAGKQGISTDWATPALVYDSVVKNILPAVQAIADEAGVTYKDYAFPRQEIEGLIPRFIYKLLTHVYGNIARYYQQTGNYDPIVLTEMTECDELSPGDVFDLSQVITSELKAEIGIESLSSSTSENYARWKDVHDTIVPGHVFRLVQYLYLNQKNAGELKI
jgi:hypothetical protein